MSVVLGNTSCDTSLTQLEISEINCAQCAKNPPKYKCPKCQRRTCSLQCSTQHKSDYQCDGIRSTIPQFVLIQGYSAYSEKLSIEDQYFMAAVEESLHNKQKLSQLKDAHPHQPQSALYRRLHANNKPSRAEKDVQFEIYDKNLTENNNEPPVKKLALESVKTTKAFCDEPLATGSSITSLASINCAEQAKTTSILSYDERELMFNAHQRRIWLNPLIMTADSNDHKRFGESRYEKFSETIFWTVTIKFVRSTALVESFTVHNIPESLRVTTLLRQFVRPKKVGPLISLADLDVAKIAPFIEAANGQAKGGNDDAFHVYMRVPCGDLERYYLMDTSKSMLENLRNRFVDGHPKLIVILASDHGFNDPEGNSMWHQLSETEARDLFERKCPKMSKVVGGDDTPSFGQGGRTGSRGLTWNIRQQYHQHKDKMANSRFRGRNYNGCGADGANRGSWNQHAYHNQLNNRGGGYGAFSRGHGSGGSGNGNSRNTGAGFHRNFLRDGRGAYWGSRRHNEADSVIDVMERHLDDPAFNT